MKRTLYRARKHAAWIVAWRSVGVAALAAASFCAGLATYYFKAWS